MRKKEEKTRVRTSFTGGKSFAIYIDEVCIIVGSKCKRGRERRSESSLIIRKGKREEEKERQKLKALDD